MLDARCGSTRSFSRPSRLIKTCGVWILVDGLDIDGSDEIELEWIGYYTTLELLWAGGYQYTLDMNTIFVEDIDDISRDG